MNFRFELLFMDDDVVVIDKPEGFHVHRPESRNVRVDPALIVLQQLRNQLGKRLYPVHRLDAPTSGCLVMALSSECAGTLSRQFESKEFKKTYTGVVRGWSPESVEINIPLESEDKTKTLESLSKLRRLGTIEIDKAVGIRHPTARYSLVELEPVTGRFHQLRRHLNRISHPLVGDVMHGDRHQNHFFIRELGIKGLCLRATRLQFVHPRMPGQLVEITAPKPKKWESIDELFGAARVCD